VSMIHEPHVSLRPFLTPDSEIRKPEDSDGISHPRHAAQVGRTWSGRVTSRRGPV
jgi:hypothetical protein